MNHAAGPLQIQSLGRDIGDHEMLRRVVQCGWLAKPGEHLGSAERSKTDSRLFTSAPGDSEAFQVITEVTDRVTPSGEHERWDPVTEDAAYPSQFPIGSLSHGIHARDHPFHFTQVFQLDLRFSGQEHALTRELSADAGVPDVLADFRAEYGRVFGHGLPGAVELVTVRVTARTPLSVTTGLVPAPPEPSRTADRAPVWCFSRRAYVEADVINRGELASRGPVSGPLLVVEPTTTTYVPLGFVAEMDDEDCLVLTRKERP